MTLDYKIILREIESSLNNSNLDNFNQFIDEILNARLVICYGAGRVGLALQGFSKRLRHLGLEGFYLEDSSVPASGFGDVLIIGSGSGSTPTVKTAAEVAAKNNLKILTITASPLSPIASISSNVLHISAPSKINKTIGGSSIQPMTTLFEQSLTILLDSFVLEIMKRTGETGQSMMKRHNVIE
jgi:6-phospho-3-hexuloisomerase